MFIQIVFSVLLSALMPRVHGEVFSSISVMEDLVQTQDKVLELYEVYLKNNEKNTALINNFIEALRIEHSIAKSNPKDYINNPINSFRIIKQLYKDWNQIFILMKRAAEEFEKNIIRINETHIFPEPDDMVGSAEAMLRLQDVYALETEDIADGVLDGNKYSSPLTSKDCFDLGVEVYNLKSFHAAQEWFKVALNKYKPGEYLADGKHLLLEYIAYNEFQMGNVKMALEKSIELHTLDPNYPRVSDYIERFQNITNNLTEMETIKPSVDPHKEESRFFYKELCKEEVDRAPSIKKDLRCRYLSSRRHFTKIAPFKVEEHSLNPYVVLYHDIIYDEEIDYILEQVKPRLSRARVVDAAGNLPAKFRISVNAWLTNGHSPIVDRINTRLEDMTGLVLQYAEDQQIGNYGIGGHYSTHFDYFAKLNTTVYDNASRGNRLATILVYMTDVELGGNTVFPRLGISVKPVKGTAVFWYNLHPSGEGNTGTLHAACPVIKGSKWGTK